MKFFYGTGETLRKSDTKPVHDGFSEQKPLLFLCSIPNWTKSAPDLAQNEDIDGYRETLRNLTQTAGNDIVSDALKTRNVNFEKISSQHRNIRNWKTITFVTVPAKRYR